MVPVLETACPNAVIDDVRPVFERATKQGVVCAKFAAKHRAPEPKIRRRGNVGRDGDHQGGVGSTIAAIHCENVGTGWARPLTRLLGLPEVAEALGWAGGHAEISS